MMTIAQKARAFDTIRLLCGYVEDGSNETVRMGQDDATRGWLVSSGRRTWYDTSLYGALEKARAEYEKEETK